jgi:hypothetical protein
VDGRWTVTATQPLPDNRYSFYATATDADDQTSGLSPELAPVDIDTTAPQFPSTPDLETASDSGLSSSDNVTNVGAAMFSGDAVAGDTVELWRNGQVVGTRVVPAGGRWMITESPAAADGTHTYTTVARDRAGNTGEQSDSLFVTKDTAGPRLVAAAFAHHRVPNQLVYQFSENVSATLGSADVRAVAVPSGAQVRPSASSYDPTTNTATFSLPTTSAHGNYRASITQGGVTDAAGNVMAAAPALDFFILTGDLNRDRVVDGRDFASLAANFGKTAGATYEQGDVNGDGAVNGSDFSLLAANFGKSVPPVVTPAAAASIAATPARHAKPRSNAASQTRVTVVRRATPALRSLVSGLRP